MTRKEGIDCLEEKDFEEIEEIKEIEEEKSIDSSISLPAAGRLEVVDFLDFSLFCLRKLLRKQFQHISQRDTNRRCHTHAALHAFFGFFDVFLDKLE